jgi:hypothetical protein
MDQIDEYLESVRKGLDIRTVAEREAIVAEMRDHLLESVSKSKDEGLSHEAAVERAVERAGDSRIVSTAISEAHDGGSWRQALLAVLPLPFFCLYDLASSKIPRMPYINRFSLFALACLLTAYFYLASRENGRRWRVPWMTAIVLLTLGVVTYAAFWVCLPHSLRTSAIAQFGTGMTLSSLHADTPLGHWKDSFDDKIGNVITLALCITGIVYMLRHSRWKIALLTVGIIPEHLFNLVHSPFTINSISYFPAVVALIILAIAYWAYKVYVVVKYARIVVVEEWRADWAMAYCVLLTIIGLSFLDPSSAHDWKQALAWVVVSATIISWARSSYHLAWPIFFACAIAIMLIQGLWGQGINLLIAVLIFPSIFDKPLVKNVWFQTDDHLGFQ